MKPNVGQASACPQSGQAETRPTITINGRALIVPEGCTVAAAVALAGVTTFRRSVTGERRAPLCGMGICFECRVTVNGQPHARSCQIVCREGMDVRTDE